MKNIVVAVLTLICVSFINNSFSQTSGNLDNGFASAGELGDPAIFPFTSSGLALSPGTEFVVTSVMHDTIQAIRYTSIGLHDINFGSSSAGFTAQIVVPGFSGNVIASLVQTDRRILVTGQYASTGLSQKGYILRLTESGTVDSTFGVNGWFFFNFFPHNGESVKQIELQEDGKIVALDVESYAGFTDTFAIARLKTDGTYDSSFAVNGIYAVPFYSFLATSPIALQIDAANNLTFAAYSNYLAQDYFYLFQLNSTGQINTAFGNGGSILIDSTNIINGGASLGLNFQNDGKLITTQTKQTGTLLWAVCRYNVDGTPDSSFGSNGMVNVQPNLDPIPYSVENIVATATGQIITAGIVNVAGSNRLIVNKFNSDGGTDAAFGNNQGTELLNCFELDDIVYNLLITPDNKILINGLVNESGYQQFEVIRLIGSTTTAVKELSSDIDFVVYPNPANTQVRVEFSKTAKGTISLKDMAGNLILNVSTDNTAGQNLDISKLAAGVYIVTLLSDEGTVSKMIVRE